MPVRWKQSLTSQDGLGFISMASNVRLGSFGKIVSLRSGLLDSASLISSCVINPRSLESPPTSTKARPFSHVKREVCEWPADARQDESLRPQFVGQSLFIVHFHVAR